ncbi:MAG: nucleoside kinase [Bacillota bacterium]|nr:nucleoside kinase [Bacillota bacterium]
MAVAGEKVYYTTNQLENQLGSRSLPGFIRNCETRLLEQLQSIANRVAWDPEIRAIFISGPSSSGKTTFTHRIASALALYGRPSITVSLDNYYSDEMEPRYVDGRPDFESLEALDVPLMIDQLETLLGGGEVIVPRFEFLTRSRHWWEENRTRIPPNGVLLVEGLHGLSPAVSARLNSSACVRVMLTPWATLGSDRSLLDSRDIRIMRRISRDVRHRGTNAVATLDYWPMMDQTEADIFPSYLEAADYFINTALAYEFLIIPKLAGDAIRSDLEAHARGELPPSTYVRDGLYYADLPRALREARRILAATDEVPAISPANVPEHSILNEFIS